MRGDGRVDLLVQDERDPLGELSPGRPGGRIPGAVRLCGDDLEAGSVEPVHEVHGGAVELVHARGIHDDHEPLDIDLHVGLRPFRRADQRQLE